MSKQRPSIDPRSYEFAEEMLRTSPKFLTLRSDIQEDLCWELGDRVQRAWEDYCEEQKIDD